MKIKMPELANPSSIVKKEKRKKKRSAPEPNVSSVETDIVQQTMEDQVDVNEPTLGEKLETMKLLEESKLSNATTNEDPPEIEPPRADSVHVMLKQALNAEDRDLLLKCLYSKDEKVIFKSVSQLNPADALQLLKSLISLIHSRGAVLVCALPWLRSLLAQHASSIISQEASVLTLNSLYQLIESRTSTFGSSLQLSAYLDLLFGGVLGDEEEKDNMPPPVIYEDQDTSDEESDEGMETNEDRGNLTPMDDSHLSDGSDVMSQ